MTAKAAASRIRLDEHVHSTLIRILVLLEPLVILDVSDGPAFSLDEERLDCRSATPDVPLRDDLARYR